MSFLVNEVWPMYLSVLLMEAWPLLASVSMKGIHLKSDIFIK